MKRTIDPKNYKRLNTNPLIKNKKLWQVPEFKNYYLSFIISLLDQRFLFHQILQPRTFQN